MVLSTCASGRLATPVFHDELNYRFEIGRGEKLVDGFDAAVISTGLMTRPRC